MPKRIKLVISVKVTREDGYCLLDGVWIHTLRHFRVLDLALESWHKGSKNPSLTFRSLVVDEERKGQALTLLM